MTTSEVHFSDLHETLRTSSEATRREITTKVLESSQANRSFYWLCHQVIMDHQITEWDCADEDMPQWEFTPHASAQLLLSRPRFEGYRDAIARAPQAESVIDAGCGSSGFLAIVAAAFHRKAEVFAYDTNEQSVYCAEEMAKLCGFGDRTVFKRANVVQTPLPDVDLAVSDTVTSGLLNEDGHVVMPVLARHAKEILPAAAALWVCDKDFETLPTTNDNDWHPVTVLDFTKPNHYVRGRVVSTGSGERTVSVYAGFYDKRNDPILTKRGADHLTQPAYLGAIPVKSKGTVINFEYALGADLDETPARLKVAV